MLLSNQDGDRRGVNAFRRLEDRVEKNPTFAKFIARAGREYATLSATPKDYDVFVAQISKMWETEPELD